MLCKMQVSCSLQGVNCRSATRPAVSHRQQQTRCFAAAALQHVTPIRSVQRVTVCKPHFSVSKGASSALQAIGSQTAAAAAADSLDVTILLGSRSDLPVAEKALKVLDQFGVAYQLRVASAHRAPKYLEGIIEDAESKGCKVFVGMAGVAAALPGVIASMTTKPVIGVPCGGKVPYDSLLSIVQMPPGMPVATVGTDRGDNAAVLAVQILAAFDAGLAAKFSEYRKTMTENVIADDQKTVSEYGK
uniref:phosphoribosylaminoimidazole carboxylase n=1 Tax=Tetraselmis sp. GSL018 TaxID=582737 RepID=A0A061S4E9_9CHLO